MISLPRGVADYLAPHPDVEIEPGRCCFLSLSSQRATAVVGACDGHETDNREPRDHECTTDHGVFLSVHEALLRRASAVQHARPERRTRKLVLAERRWLGSGFAPGQLISSPAHTLRHWLRNWSSASAKRSGAAHQQVRAKGPSAKRESNAPSNACMSGR